MATRRRPSLTDFFCLLLHPLFFREDLSHDERVSFQNFHEFSGDFHFGSPLQIRPGHGVALAQQMIGGPQHILEDVLDMTLSVVDALLGLELVLKSVRRRLHDGNSGVQVSAEKALLLRRHRLGRGQVDQLGHDHGDGILLAQPGGALELLQLLALAVAEVGLGLHPGSLDSALPPGQPVGTGGARQDGDLSRPGPVPVNEPCDFGRAKGGRCQVIAE